MIEFDRRRAFAFLSKTQQPKREAANPLAGQLGSLSIAVCELFISFLFLSFNGAPKGKVFFLAERKKRGIIYNTSAWHVPFVSILICFGGETKKKK